MPKRYGYDATIERPPLPSRIVPSGTPAERVRAPERLEGRRTATGAERAEKAIDQDYKVHTGSFPDDLKPIEIVSALPSLPDTDYPEGTVVFLTTDDKLYRSLGASWTKAVDGGDITALSITTDALVAGAVTAAKISVSQLSAIAADVGTLTAGKIQNSGGNYGVLLSGTIPGGWTRWLNLVDTSKAFLKHEKLALDWDGTADFSGDVSATEFKGVSVNVWQKVVLGKTGDFSAPQEWQYMEHDVLGFSGIVGDVGVTYPVLTWKTYTTGSPPSAGFVARLNDRYANEIFRIDMLASPKLFDFSQGSYNVKAGELTVSDTLYVDHLLEYTAAHGIDADGVGLKDGNVTSAAGTRWRVHTGGAAGETSYIDFTAGRGRFGYAGAGYTVTGALIYSGAARGIIFAPATVEAGYFDANGDLYLANELHVDTLLEKTPAAGVTIDLVQLKDGDVTIPATNQLIFTASGASEEIIQCEESLAIPTNDDPTQDAPSCWVRFEVGGVATYMPGYR